MFMIKNFRKFKVAFCIFLSIPLFILSSCTYTYSGTFWSLNILFEHELITEDNLKNIAALRNNGILQKVIDYTSDPIELETIEYEVIPVSDELSNDQSNKILDDFNNQMNEAYKEMNVTINSSEIIGYYGTYDSCSIVEIEYTLNGLDVSSDTYSSFIVSDYYFGLLADNCVLWAWIANS